MKKLLSLLLMTAAFCGSAAHAENLVAAAGTDGMLKIFVRALEAAGLSDTLKGSGPFTIFAPTDHAFETLPAGTLDALMRDKVRLAQVLNYHIVPGKTLVAEIKPGETTTMQGDPLKLTSDNGKITVNDANVIQSDIPADNGVIHAIDAVLMPR